MTFQELRGPKRKLNLQTTGLPKRARLPGDQPNGTKTNNDEVKFVVSFLHFT